MSQAMLPGFEESQPPPANMDAARAEAVGCTRCRLSEERARVVWGAGNPHAEVMLVGVGPSISDDRTGQPYSGPAGHALDAALAAVGLTRDDVWLTNAHKCVAKKDNYTIRNPTKTELKACRPWLDIELALVQPKVIVVIGTPAAKTLLGDDFKLTEQRGQWLDGPDGIPTLATFQPSYYLRIEQHDPQAAEEARLAVIEDFRKAVARVKGI
jgi:DNA polymerase